MGLCPGTWCSFCGSSTFSVTSYPFLGNPELESSWVKAHGAAGKAEPDMIDIGGLLPMAR